MLLDRFVLFTAFRYFGAKKNEKFVSIISSISLIGITLGTAALVIVMSVMNGFHAELINNVVGLNGDIKITPQNNSIIHSHDTVIQQIAGNDFVKNITPAIIGQAMALGSNLNMGVLVRGIELIDLKHKGEILQNILEGSFTEYEGTDSIAIGYELARNIGAHAGSKIKLVAPVLLPTMFGSMPRARDFKVVAVFSSGLFDYDAVTILMPLAAAQKFFSMNHGINLLEVNIVDQEKAGYYSSLLRHQLDPNLYIRSWIEDNKQFLNALAVERIAMFVILSLIILVAAFNIISSLFMLVKDKTRDIAILKTIGVSTKQIMLIFIVNGFLVGVIGTVLGVSLGLVFSYNIENVRKFLEKATGFTIFDPAIYFLYRLPSVVNLGDVIIVASIAIILSLLATIYPAYRAASINPIEAMRYE